MNNPYNYNLPVSDHKFCGREEDIEFLIERLAAPYGDSFALIGGRRIGKTSLLEVLEKKLSTYDSDQNQCIKTLLLDLNKIHASSEFEFLQIVVKEILIRFDSRLSLESDGAVGYWLERFLVHWNKLEVEQNGRLIRFVLLLDHCDRIIDQDWVHSLYAVLRGLLESSGTRDLFKLVMAGSQRFLVEVQQAGSPLRDILEHYYLSSLSYEATYALVSRVKLHPTNSRIARAVYIEGGGHPFLLQYLMHNLWGKDINSLSVEDVVEVGFRFSQFRQDFEKWWLQWDRMTRKVYVLLAETKNELSERQIRIYFRENNPSNILQILNILVCYGVIWRNNSNSFQVGAAMFQRWLISSGWQEVDNSVNNRWQPSDAEPFYKAILASYDINSLKRMLRFGLNRDLHQMIKEGGFEEVVFELIRKAETGGWIDKLVIAAHAYNIDNDQLKDFINRYNK